MELDELLVTDCAVELLDDDVTPATVLLDELEVRDATVDDDDDEPELLLEVRLAAVLLDDDELELIDCDDDDEVRDCAVDEDEELE